MDHQPTQHNDAFEPATAAGPCFSLREHLVAQRVNDLSSALNTAHAIVSTIRGVDLRRYRAAYPMSGISSA